MLTTKSYVLTRSWPGLEPSKGTGEIPVSLLASVDAAAKKLGTRFILNLVPAGLSRRTNDHSALQHPGHWKLVSNGRLVH